jgi:hypothetical protein
MCSPRSLLASSRVRLVYHGSISRVERLESPIKMRSTYDMHPRPTPVLRQITHPAPAASCLKQRRYRGVRCICFVRCHHLDNK